MRINPDFTTSLCSWVVHPAHFYLPGSLVENNTQCDRTEGGGSPGDNTSECNYQIQSAGFNFGFGFCVQSFCPSVGYSTVDHYAIDIQFTFPPSVGADGPSAIATLNNSNATCPPLCQGWVS